MSEPTFSGNAQWAGMSFDALCQLRPRPILMDGLFRDYMTKHFSQPGLIEEPDLRELIWKPNDTTGIVIEVVQKWDPTKSNRRPAIVIKRNSYKNRKVGIGNRLQMQPGDREGQPHFSTFWVGSHTLFALGGTGAQANLLGTEIQRELTQFANELIRDLGLEQLDVMEVGPLSLVKEATDTYAVPIVVTYAYNERWTVRLQAPRLRRISLSRILE